MWLHILFWANHFGLYFFFLVKFWVILVAQKWASFLFIYHQMQKRFGLALDCRIQQWLPYLLYNASGLVLLDCAYCSWMPLWQDMWSLYFLIFLWRISPLSVLTQTSLSVVTSFLDSWRFFKKLLQCQPKHLGWDGVVSLCWDYTSNISDPCGFSYFILFLGKYYICCFSEATVN